MPKDVLFQ